MVHFATGLYWLSNESSSLLKDREFRDGNYIAKLKISLYSMEYEYQQLPQNLDESNNIQMRISNAVIDYHTRAV